MKISAFLGETTEYEKKEMLEERRPKSWLKSVSAFANGIGGALIFGVDDNDNLTGLEDARKTSEKISELINAKMDPVPQVVLDIHEETGRQFIILKVFHGNETPYYYIGDGSRIAYVRIGNESVPAGAADLKRLVLRGSNSTFDSLSSSYPLGTLSFTKLRSVYRIRTGSELTEQDFISFELADENGMLTNAGLLMADDPPVRHSRLFCTRWHGLDKASGTIDALDDKEYSGSLISLLQNGTEFVKNNSKKRWKKTGDGRIEMPDYPTQAVHEVIVNALIHRDYMETGSEVHIDIFDDHLEVYSPGGMPDGSAVQDMDTDNVASKRRNPVIADIFSRMQFMERRGSGFRKIKADYSHAANYYAGAEPKFRSTPTSFFVSLFNLNYNAPEPRVAFNTGKVLIEDQKVLIDRPKVLIEKEKVLIDPPKVLIENLINRHDIAADLKNVAINIIEQLGEAEIFGRSDIMRISNLSITAAGNVINKLKSAGLIEPVRGHGKGKYKFVVSK